MNKSLKVLCLAIGISGTIAQSYDAYWDPRTWFGEITEGLIKQEVIDKSGREAAAKLLRANPNMPMDVKLLCRKIENNPDLWLSFIGSDPTEMRKLINGLSATHKPYVTKLIELSIEEVASNLKKITGDSVFKRTVKGQEADRLLNKILQETNRQVDAFVIFEPELTKLGEPKKRWALWSPFEKELTPTQRLKQDVVNWVNKQWQAAKDYWALEARKATRPTAKRSFERLEGLAPMEKDYGVWRGFKEKMPSRLQNLKDRYSRSLEQINERLDVQTTPEKAMRYYGAEYQ